MLINAIEMTTRCCIPPESWCGYRRALISGSGICVRRIISMARWDASRREIPWWRRSTSPIWSPTEIDGLSELIGSW